MRLSHITIQGFKSFAKKTTLDVTHQVTGVVGPNGSGKSNIAEAIRFVLGEQSMKSMRGKTGADVIFKGSEHLSPLSRASVMMVIDNKDKGDVAHASDALAPYLVYDELTLSRVIYADGTSDYMLNGAKIRLKDVQELLSFAGIGGSAHTIINQGEADRILLANPKDRKEALEDALGLRVYHMRLQESKRKLERVKTHVHEVGLLRKEIKPHLDHLKRQVDKIEAASEERNKLHVLLIAYLTREESELQSLDERIREEGSSASLILITASIVKELQVLKDVTSTTQVTSVSEKHTLQTEMRAFLERRDQVTKTLGRLEAEKEYLEKELTRSEEANEENMAVTISHEKWNSSHAIFSHEIIALAVALTSSDIQKATTHIDELTHEVEEFFGTHNKEDITKKESLQRDSETVTQSIVEHEQKEQTLSRDVVVLQEKIDAIDVHAQITIASRHEEEKKIMILQSKLRELQSTIALRRQEEGEFSLRKQHFEALGEEGVIIVGRVVLEYKSHSPDERFRNTPKQDILRAIERSKLRIEEAGVPNREEVIAEYASTRERDEYLSGELTDIKDSEEKLLTLIDELTSSLQERFSKGVEDVSKVFSEFLGEVFVGGKGKLVLLQLTKIDEDGNQIVEQGIDIDVSIPHKKVKELIMFSGGERALVSIALLFAMSSIKPPPFIVLDETDASLDESNARKYGVMLKRLSEKSKLLVITHNRETMNHCDMLYGVTIGVDGGSKLLSINFKETSGFVQ